MEPIKVNFPWTTVAVFFIIVIGVVVLITTGNASAGAVTVLLGLLPGVLVGAGFAERTNKDIRNGTIVEKSRQGTVAALSQAGITPDSMQQSYAVTNAALGALTKLLENNTAATQANTAELQKGTAQNG